MDKIKIQVPTSWNDVTLGQYIKISKMGKPEKEYTELKYLIDLILILCPNLTRDVLENITEEKLLEITGDWQWMTTLPTDNIVKEFNIGSEKYIYDKEVEKLTLGEMVSYETLVDSDEMTQSDTLSLVLAIILRKEIDGVVEDFNPDEIYNRIKLFEDNISIEQAYGLVFFFLIGGKTSTSYLEDCLNQMRTLMN